MTPHGIGSWLLAVGLLAPAKPESLSPGELDRWIPGLLEASGVPGLSLALLREGRIAVSSAYGVANEESGEPVEPGTIFEAASLSKPVFAYGVLLLAREGRLDLDRPLASYGAPEPTTGDPRLGRITARMVLSHSSGFPNWRPGRWTDAPGPLTIDFEPGTRFGYSGEGYEYLRMVVERITAVPIEEYLQKNVMGPLGMRSSSFVWRESYESRAATGHDRGRAPTRKWRPRDPNVAGSLHTTAGDYARFLLEMLASPGSDIAALMMSPQTGIDESLDWGLGWGLESSNTGKRFWHWGDNDSFQAFVMGSPRDRSAVVVFTNGQNGLRACQAVVRAVLGREHPALEFPMLQY